MNKQAIIICGSLLGAALVGAVSANVVLNSQDSPSEGVVVETTIEDVFRESLSDNSLNHFTSYSQERYPDLTYAAENAVKAVVNIEVVVEYQSRASYDPFLEFFGIPQGYGEPSTREARGGGSGVLISSDGYIVTNNHVVDNAKSLKVKLNDGRSFDAEIIGTDPTTDVALLKIEGSDFPFLKFGSSDDLRLGEWVLAIGSPFNLQSTITAGIVSAKARNLGAIPTEYSIESFIQTDAAVNPGNSGGALVNTAGLLVGINTLIQSPSGSYIGYSFAVPSSIVQKVVVDLKEYGVVQRALLGVQYAPITSDFLEKFGEEYGLEEVGGAYVVEVTEGGAAEAAGILKGDIITAIDGVEIDSSANIAEIIAKHRPGEKIKISVKRDNKVKPFEVTLRNKAGKTDPVSKQDLSLMASLGGKFETVSDDLARRLDIDGGVVVTKVEPDGILARARVKKGFVITHLNDKPVVNLATMERLLTEGKLGEKIYAIDGVNPSTGRGVSLVLVE